MIVFLTFCIYIDDMNEFNDIDECEQLEIGLFGGSFDPIHNGHLGLARKLIAHGILDKILFMPAATAPHKPQRACASSEHRLSMLRLAICDEANFEVSDYEIRRGGTSYTIDTVQRLLTQYGDGLRLVIGMDSLQEIHKWHRGRELVRRCPIVIYRRPNVREATFAELAEHFGKDVASELSTSIVDADTFDVSSTNVRLALKRGESVEHLVPSAVYEYIVANGLYN